MKHVLNTVLLLLLLAAFSACKKNYTCECTVSSNGTTLTTASNISDKKKKAKAFCEKDPTTYPNATQSCVLKD